LENIAIVKNHIHIKQLEVTFAFFSPEQKYVGLH